LPQAFGFPARNGTNEPTGKDRPFTLAAGSRPVTLRQHGAGASQGSEVDVRLVPAQRGAEASRVDEVDARFVPAQRGAEAGRDDEVDARPIKHSSNDRGIEEGWYRWEDSYLDR